MVALAILCLHRVLPASRRGGPDEPYFQRQTALTLDRFCALLDALERRAAVLPPEALLGRDPCARPGVILTFDDGYADVLEIAAPELDRRGMRAILCVTTAIAAGVERGFPVDHWYARVTRPAARTGVLEGLTGERWSFDLDRAEDRARLIDGPEKRAFVCAAPDEQRAMLDRLARALGVEAPAALPEVLDAAGLAALAQRGWTLGSHGDRHALLPLLAPGEAAEDLARSRAFFAARGLPPPHILAYPDGATCPRTEAMAAAAGFSVGLALGSRFATESDPMLRLPRLIPTNDPGWFERRLLPLFSAESAEGR